MNSYFGTFFSIGILSISSNFFSAIALQPMTSSEVRSYVDQIKRFVTSRNPLILQLNAQPFSCSEEELQFYRRYVEVDAYQSLVIFERTEHRDNNRWQMERQIRITSSAAYGLYTYAEETKQHSREEWQRKVGNLALKDMPPNQFLEYVRQNQPTALEVLNDMIEAKGGKLYTRTGLMINTNLPWLAFSPDAYVHVNGKYSLVEVKCPLIGRHTKGIEFLKGVDYIYNNNGIYEMRKKNTYYAQIQLGLLLSNIKTAKLVLYCKLDDSIHVINVEYDAEYTENLVAKLKTIYFKYYLPFIYLQREKLYKIKFNYWTLE